jgi:hypothetical protein
VAHGRRDAGRREGVAGWPFTSSGYATIRAAGLRDKVDLLDALGTCIRSPIAALLTSPDPLIRALAMLDRRLGTRRLAKLDMASEHPLVVELHRLRRDAEAVRPHA